MLREKDFVNPGPDSSFKVAKMDVPESELSCPSKFSPPLGLKELFGLSNFSPPTGFRYLCYPGSTSSYKMSEKNVDSISPSPLPTSSSHVQRTTYLKIHLDKDGSFAPCDPKFEKGTTAFGFTFDKGIMVCINHSEPAKNVVLLNSHMLATISGGSEFLLQDLQKRCNKREQEEGRETSVAEALKLLTDALSVYQEKLPIGILIAVGNGSELGMYRINGQGKVVTNDVLATGSGSGFTYPLESCFGFSCRPNRRLNCNMSISEATNLAKSAICLAAISAPHSADCFSVYYIGRMGCKKILEGDVDEWRKLHYKNCQIVKYVVIGPGW